jgi:hypothetical protein
MVYWKTVNTCDERYRLVEADATAIWHMPGFFSVLGIRGVTGLNSVFKQMMPFSKSFKYSVSIS